MDKICIILPTYNEADNIVNLIKKIFLINKNFNIIVVDDNSPDLTYKIVEKKYKNNPNVFLIKRQKKLGLGTAYKDGFKKALEINSQKIITMDADFSHDPKYLEEVVRKSKKFDLIIGSRYVKGGGIKNWPNKRVFLSKIANFCAKKLLGIKTNDCTAGFRCYDSLMLSKIDLNSIKSNGYSFLIEILYAIEKANFKINEVPIVFTDRVRGKSKISKKEIVNAIITILKARS